MIHWLLLLAIFCLPYNNFPFAQSGAMKPLSGPLFLVVALLILLSPGKWKLKWAGSDSCLVLFFGWLTLSGVINLMIGPPAAAKPLVSPTGGLLEFIGFASISLAAYFSGRCFMHYFKPAALQPLLIMSFIPSILAGLHQIASNYGPLAVMIRRFFATTYFPVGYDRVTLLTTEPSFAGLDISCFLLPLTVSLALQSKGAGRKIGIILSLLALLILYKTRSLTGVLCLLPFIGVSIWDYWSVSNVRTRMVILATTLMVVMGLGGVWTTLAAASELPGSSGESVLLRLVSVSQDVGGAGEDSAVDQSAAVRLLSQTGAIQLCASHPIMGIGPRNFGYYFQEVVPPIYVDSTLITDYIDPSSKRFANVKSTFLDALTSGGVPGLFFLILFCFTLLHSHKGGNKDQVQGLARIIVINLLFSGLLTLPLIGYPLFWFPVGILVSLKARSGGSPSHLTAPAEIGT